MFEINQINTSLLNTWRGNVAVIYVIDEVVGLNNKTLNKFESYLNKLSENNIEYMSIKKYGNDIAEYMENLFKEF